MAWESEIFYIPDKNYYIIFLSVNVKYLAERSRTTVEALELKGYRYANENKIVEKKENGITNV